MNVVPTPAADGEVIGGAFRVLDELNTVGAHAEGMKAVALEPPEELAFATAALALPFGEATEEGAHRAPP